MLTARFWLANRFTLGSVDLLFRVASASVLSPAARSRFLHAGIGERQVTDTLRRVRRVHGWSGSWVRSGGSYLESAVAERQRGEPTAAAREQAAAALCYHFAGMFEIEDVTHKRRLYRRAAALFQHAAPGLDPAAEHVEVPWRDTSLPGYLRFPTGTHRPLPLVVLLNGASTAKEEMTLWSGPFLRRGIATLALDTPGSGEAWDRVHGRPDQQDIADALIAFGEAQPRVDARRIAVLGISLGGAAAVRLAGHNADLAAVVSVTAPFHPAPYFRHLNRVVRHEVAFVAGARPDDIDELVAQVSLLDVAPRLRVPLLVVGAGHDLVVPPDESPRLYQAAGGPKRLLFLERANHAGFSHMPEWTGAAADWLAATITA
ncbi:MAG TPA: alpha/beta fold hydrolase [Thermomicrobiaceae bacterium]|nr:alpha/beta fold hydrolase [Thermomicrobiaceae bacterium]